MFVPALLVEYRDPADLKPDPGNARVHPKKQIDQIAANMDRNGFYNPVLIDEFDVLIAGHGRLLGAKRLGLKSIPTIRLTGMTAAQKRKLQIADNRIAQNAAWDVD